ncbi:MAG: hypothetical protein FWG98_05015 [Candidatus Cloacimonetes bacterium]|nr:hypothetical protein [Candidatus Cloacimonadota bacterium]
MFEFCIFEIKYRLRYISTYVFAFLLIGLTVLDQLARGGALWGVSTAMGDKLFINSPYSIFNHIDLILKLSIFMMAAFIHQMFSKDFENKFSYLLLCKPITKTQYILGRFLGNFIIMMMMIVVSMITFGLSVYLPGIDKEMIGGFNLYWYIEPIFTMVIPNYLFISVLFIAIVIATKKSASVFGMGFVIYTMQTFANHYGSKIENQVLSTLIDPFGSRAFNLATRGWSAVEMNTQTIGLPYFMLYNRILWVSVSLIIFFIAWKMFKFENVFKQKMKKIDASVEAYCTRSEDKEVIDCRGVLRTPNTKWRIQYATTSFFTLFKFYFTKILRSPSFYWISGIGVALMISGAHNHDSYYGTRVLPVTIDIIYSIHANFNVLWMVILTFFTGELIWGSRDNKISLIEDSLPLSNFVSFFSKYVSMAVFIGIYYLLMVVVGVIYQTIKGYYIYEFDVYFINMFFDFYPFMLIWLMLIFVIHNFANNKYLAHFLSILAFLGTDLLSLFRIQHPLFLVFNLNDMLYSDMSGFGGKETFVAWMYLFGFLLASVLASISVMCWKRGLEQKYCKNMLITLKTRKGLLINGVLVCSTLLVAGFIFYNTNVLNDYHTVAYQEKIQIEYEKSFKHFERQNQPKIHDVKMNVDIYPEKSEMIADGIYLLKNSGETAIDTVFVHRFHRNVTKMDFDVDIKEIINFKDHDLTLFVLENSLEPGDSLSFSFDYHIKKRGILANDIRRNGTFINSGLFPSFGYQTERELRTERRRKKLGLPDREDRWPDTDDPYGLSRNYIISDSDWTSFEVTVSTSGDQIALAPGELVASWTEEYNPPLVPPYKGGQSRNYYTYRIDQNMIRFFTFMSARYEVKRDKWNDIDLEIYYHPGHDFNLDSMMQGMKESLEYFTPAYSPYPYNVLRIAEFPRYARFAQAFLTLIPFSENIGFIADVRENTIDYPFYITAHEIAHQWWAHQVIGSRVRGTVMLSESFTEYASLMVVKNRYNIKMDNGQWTMDNETKGNDFLYRRQLNYTLRSYLNGRSYEQKFELPLSQAENQQYLVYSKGMLIMNAMSRLIGEDVLNQALREFLESYQYASNPYPNSWDFMNVLDFYVPDSLKTIVDEMFNQVVLHDLNILEVSSTEQDEGTYKTIIDFSTEKTIFDNEGIPETLEWSGWLEIGLIEDIENDMNNIFHLEKVWINNKENTVEIISAKQPDRVILDPYVLLMARDLDSKTSRVNARDLGNFRRAGSGAIQFDLW